MIKRLFVAHNEPEEIRTLLQKKYNATVSDLGVGEGDALIETVGGKVIRIERKRPDDLVASIFDQRLFTTCETLGNGSGLRFLAIDGKMLYDDTDSLILRRGNVIDRTTKKKVIVGAYRRVQLLGVIVEELQMPYAEWLDFISAWADRLDIPPVNRNPIELPDYWNTYNKDTFQFIASLPNIGAKRAMDFMDWHGRQRSIASVLERLFKPFDKRDKPVGWSAGIQKGLRDYFGLGENEVFAVVSRPEWNEELDDIGRKEHDVETK
jgi:ERCC4-type nuclease